MIVERLAGNGDVRLVFRLACHVADSVYGEVMYPRCIVAQSV